MSLVLIFQSNWFMKNIARTLHTEAGYLAVDYNNVNQIESILRENNVDVVVSALVLLGTEEASSQINLIRGAAQSGTVTKFIPSEYHLDFHAPVS